MKPHAPLLALLALASLAALPSPAAAQDVAPAAAPAAAPTAAPRREPVRGEVIRVRGVVQRPYAFGVTGRAPLGYTALDNARTFAPEVTLCLRRDPF